MKKIEKLKLNQFSKDELGKRELSHLRGGAGSGSGSAGSSCKCACVCSCGCSGNESSTESSNTSTGVSEKSGNTPAS
jgi:natural product precursor